MNLLELLINVNLFSNNKSNDLNRHISTHAACARGRNAKRNRTFRADTEVKQEANRKKTLKSHIKLL